MHIGRTLIGYWPMSEQTSIDYRPTSTFQGLDLRCKGHRAPLCGWTVKMIDLSCKCIQLNNLVVFFIYQIYNVMKKHVCRKHKVRQVSGVSPCLISRFRTYYELRYYNIIHSRVERSTIIRHPNCFGQLSKFGGIHLLILKHFDIYVNKCQKWYLWLNDNRKPVNMGTKSLVSVWHCDESHQWCLIFIACILFLVGKNSYFHEIYIIVTFFRCK